MRILVTGGTGFVGGALARTLLDQGHRVTVLTRKGNEYKPRRREAGVVLGDVLTPESLDRAFSKQDIVIHLAALTGWKGSKRADFDATNVQGTRNVMEAALRAGTDRVVYTSSTSIYGNVYTDEIDEETPPRPHSHYARTKYEGEQVVKSYASRHGLSTVSIRLSSVYGPGATSWRGLIGAVDRGRFRLLGDGTNYFQVGYLTDLAAGLAASATTDGVDGDTFILSGMEQTTLGEYIDLIAKELNVPLKSNLPGLPFYMVHRLGEWVFNQSGIQLPISQRYHMFFNNKRYNLGKAKDKLGYDSKVGLAEGIYNMIRHYHR